MFRIPKGNRQLFHLFYYWFRQRCFCFTSFNVVSFATKTSRRYHKKISNLWDNFKELKFHHFRLPYDWKNPPLYLVTLYLQRLYAMFLCQYMGCFVFLAFGVFMFAHSFVEDMKQKLYAINKMAHRKRFRSRMYVKLSKFINLHAKAKQLSRMIFILF